MQAPSDVQLQAYPHTDDNSNMYKLFNAREQATRESFVAIETVKILQHQISECYKREGVNHLQNCRDLRLKLAAIYKDPELGKLRPQV
ncbi:unnamed protein product [Heterosigma akashiwo]|mmetsp:Transcript_718/g.889  ORF Transcript_718/g.889 Transcript_718/m.889 type:complete len:88 (+) Transcript_718:59-322(+)